MNSSLFTKKGIIFYDKTRNNFIITTNGCYVDDIEMKLFI